MSRAFPNHPPYSKTPPPLTLTIEQWDALPTKSKTAIVVQAMRRANPQVDYAGTLGGGYRLVAALHRVGFQSIDFPEAGKNAKGVYCVASFPAGDPREGILGWGATVSEALCCVAMRYRGVII